MSEHMKKRPINSEGVEVMVRGHTPAKFIIHRSNTAKLIAFLKTLSVDDNDLIPADVVFKELDRKYGKVGVNIRGLRARDGMTQKELAKKLNIHQVHVSQIENGKRVVGKNLAYKLAKVFNTDYRLFL